LPGHLRVEGSANLYLEIPNELAELVDPGSAPGSTGCLPPAQRLDRGTIVLTDRSERRILQHPLAQRSSLARQSVEHMLQLVRRVHRSSPVS